MTRVAVRQLSLDAVPAEIVAVLARAFWDDPLFDFLTRDRLAEYRVLPRVFAAAMTDFRSDASELYVADVSGEPRAFAGWLGPGVFPRSYRDRFFRNLRAARVLVRLEHRLAAASLLGEVERRHPAEPHWYLALLGTDPTAQGRGLGTALLAPVLERCDAERLPAYTETQTHDNVVWYGRSGFEVIDELRVAGAPTIWRLWREPHPAHT